MLGGGSVGLSLAVGSKRKGFKNLVVYEFEKGKNKIIL